MRRLAVAVCFLFFASAAHAQFDACVPLQLTSGNTRVSNPSFSADGKRVVFASGSNITGQNADGSWEIFLLDRTTNAVTQITSWPGPGYGNSYATISGDGTWIGYTHTEPAGHQIRLYNIATGATTNVTNVGGPRFGPSLDDHASRVVYQDDAGITRLQMYERVTGQTTTIANFGSHGHISGDGSRVVYHVDSSIYLKNIDTNILALIGSSNGGFNPGPSISADGLWAAWGYSAQSTLTETAIMVFDVVHGTSQSIYSGTEWVQNPVVSNGGSFVAFSSATNVLGTNANGGGEVFVYDMAQHTLAQLTSGPGTQYSSQQVFAANGELAFVSAANLTGQNPNFTDQLFMACGGNIPPVARAGADVTVSTAGSCSANVTLDGSASSDANGDSLTYSWSAPFSSTGVTATKTLAPGTYNVTLTVNDGRGGTSTDTVLVRVVDGEPPTFTSTIDPISVDTHDSTGRSVSVPLPVVTDACGDATVVSDAPFKFPVGTTTVHFTAHDAAGNTATSSTTVTVNLVNTAPVAHVNDVTTKTTDHCVAHVGLNAGGSTDVDGDVITFSWSAPFTGVLGFASADLGPGTYTATLTVNDGHGGVSMDDSTIVVTDGELPVFTSTVAPITVETHEAVAQTVTVPLPSASDTCGAVTVTSDAPATFPVGTTTVHFTARDAAGNTATSSTTVTVKVINQPPVAKVVLVSRDAGFCGEVFRFDASGSSDPDGDPLTFQWPAALRVQSAQLTAIYPPGPHTVTVVVTDGHGGSSTASVDFTAVDAMPPLIQPETLRTIEVTTHDPSGTAVPLPAVTAFDGCGGPVTLTNDAPAKFPVGITLVTFTATDQLGNASKRFLNVYVTFVNAAPQARASAPAIVDAVDCTGSVTLDGSASTDPDGDALTYTWTGDFGTATGAHPTIALPVGVHVIRLTVVDPFHAGSFADVTVTVRDVSAPVVNSVKASPDSLWPPNHQMVPVTVTVDVSDGCGSASCHIESVTSNEPDNGLGDGDTPNDISITGALTVGLRAERSGKGNGRIYTINLLCTDASGNETRKSIEVKVPKNAK
jgi:Tol biopolymer transport system component